MTVEHPRTVALGKVIANAFAFNPKHWTKSAVNAESLPQTVVDLLTLLRERDVAFVLVGGLAMLQYVSGRNTEDIDMIVPWASLKRLPEIDLIDQNADFARGRFRGLQIDFLLARNKLFDTVRRRYTAVQEYYEQPIRTATVAGLVLLKLYALPSLYRQADFTRVAIYEADLATLIQAYRPPLDPLLTELARHMSDTDIVAVREILSDIEARIQRFEQGRNDGS
jgi:hypothetical protein